MRSLSPFQKAMLGRSRWSRCTGNEAAHIAPQCEDGVELWARYLGMPCFPRKGDARDILRYADPKIWNVHHYRPGDVPPEGAIIVAQHKTNGHTMIAREGCTRRTIRSLDQNWSRKNHFTLEQHPYSGTDWKILGWITPHEAAPAPALEFAFYNPDGSQHNHDQDEGAAVAYLKQMPLGADIKRTR